MKRISSALFIFIIASALILAATPSHAALKGLLTPEYIINVIANIPLGSRYYAASDVLGYGYKTFNVSDRLGRIAFVNEYRREQIEVDVFTTRNDDGYIFGIVMYVTPVNSVDVARLQNAIIDYIRKNLDISPTPIQGKMGWTFYEGEHPYVLFTDREKHYNFELRQEKPSLKVVKCWKNDITAFSKIFFMR